MRLDRPRRPKSSWLRATLLALMLLAAPLIGPVESLASAPSPAAPTPTRTPGSDATPTTSPSRTTSPSSKPTPTRTADPIPSRTPTPAPTTTPTLKPTPTRTPTPTATPARTYAPVPTGPAKPIPTEAPTVTPTTFPSCASPEVNLVQNPSFETVSGSPSSIGDWAVYEPVLGASAGVATTQVSGWTRTITTADWPKVVNNGTPWAPTRLAIQGSRFALIPARGSQGLVGTLSTATSGAATYLLSAHLATADVVNAPVFEMRLRNSTTGAESAPVLQAPLSLTSSWALLSGTVPSGAGFDRVVLRYQASLVIGSDNGFVDSVQVCQAALASTGPSTEPATGWWTSARLVGAVVTSLLGVGAVAMRTHRRRKR